MKRLERIVVATDLSDMAAAVCAQAVTLARRTGAQLTLVWVDENAGFSFPALPHVEQALAQMYQRRAAVLEDACRTLEAVAGTNMRILRGEPASQLIAICRETAADLLMIGRHAPKNSTRSMLGRTTRVLLRSCPIPLWIVPAHDRAAAGPLGGSGIRELCVPSALDGTARACLSAAAEMADALSCSVSSVHVHRIAPTQPKLDQAREAHAPVAPRSRGLLALSWMQRLGEVAHLRPHAEPASGRGGKTPLPEGHVDREAIVVSEEAQALLAELKDELGSEQAARCSGHVRPGNDVVQTLASFAEEQKGRVLVLPAMVKVNIDGSAGHIVGSLLLRVQRPVVLLPAGSPDSGTHSRGHGTARAA